MNWHVHEDGSFDLLGSEISLKNAYPAFDGVHLRPIALNFRISGPSNTIEYILERGTVELTLDVQEDLATLLLTMSGWAEAPRTVELIKEGTVAGTVRAFRQGRGMCGDSGVVDLKRPVESFGMLALLSPSGSGLSVWSPDGRRFESRFLVSKPEHEPAMGLTVRFETEKVPIPDQVLELPMVKFAPLVDAGASMRAAARDFAATMGARPIRRPSYHWCSWYYLYHNLDMPILAEYLDAMSAMQLPPELDYFQIDAGYFPSLGDWLTPSTRFPEGLEPAFERIRAAGYRPGIWIGPFMVGNRSQLAKAHPDWLLRDSAGELLTPWRGYGEPKTWGYRDEETYILDSSHPEAFEYLHSVFRTFKNWGAEMIKTDFMYWGLHDSQSVQRHRPGKTSVEYFREVLSMIRDEIGEDTFWLGCIAPFFPFVGYADAMRIGGDVGTAWDGRFGPQSMLTETVGNQHLNQILWQNDPDVLLIRDFHTELNEDEVQSLALWQSFMGGVVAASDPLHEISPARLHLWNFVRPEDGASVAELPFLTQPDRPLTALRKWVSGQDWVLVFNVTELRVRDSLFLDELGIKEPRFVYRSDLSNLTLVGEGSEIQVDLKPHHSALFCLSPISLSKD